MAESDLNEDSIISRLLEGWLSYFSVVYHLMANLKASLLFPQLAVDPERVCN